MNSVKKMPITEKFKMPLSLVWSLVEEQQSPYFTTDEIVNQCPAVLKKEFVEETLDKLRGRGAIERQSNKGESHWVRVTWWECDGEVHKVFGDSPPSPRGITQRCAKCGMTKSEEGFFWSNKRPGELTKWCRDCHAS